MRKHASAAVGAAAILGLVAAPFVAVQSASANTAGSDLVLSEVYGGGGNSGSTYTNDFIELYNPTDASISVANMAVEYFSSSGNSGGSTALTGSVPAHGHYLVQEAKGSGGTTPLPAPDATGSLSLSGSKGSVELSRNGTVVDLVGYGDAAKCEGACAAPLTNATSASRSAVGTDTDDNATDFTAGEPTPSGTGGGGGEPPPTTTDATIAEIQGTGASSPLVGQTVETRGVVTAAYPRGGFYGYVIQTPGADMTPGASDGLYVYQPRGAVTAQIGDYLEVTGKVSEYSHLTELSVAAEDVTVLTEAHEPAVARTGDYPTTDAAREAHESELLDVSGQHFTVTDNYSTNQYAEIGLATGDTPLVTPTEVADAQDAAAIAAVKADNHARAVTLDDGSSTNFLPYGGGDNQDIPLPWLGTDNPVRVGSAATFHQPVILDYRNNTWKFQPTHQVTDEGRDVVGFENTRADDAAPQDVGGDLRLATFNVLNYFNTTGADWVDSGHTCTFYEDREGDPVTDNRCEPNGPRGAAEDEDLARQQIKIVKAINAMGADIVSLEEIENSVALGESNRDDALKDLVAALNADAGTTRWARVPSPPASKLPPLDQQDVIRTAFIYNPARVDLVGTSTVLSDQSADGEPFENAREPLAQAFTPAGAGRAEAFGVIVNHFKSKGSGFDDHTGQGNANPDRIRQAHALSAFADSWLADRKLDKLFLTGDFNSYSMEDPVQVLEADGYTNLKSDQADEWSYNYDGESGSLDHVFANQAAMADVAGVDVWNINADEAVAFEYSRYNYNVTNFYQANQFRASDHDPEVVGINVG